MTWGEGIKRSRVTRSVKIWINKSKKKELRTGGGMGCQFCSLLNLFVLPSRPRHEIMWIRMNSPNIGASGTNTNNGKMIARIRKLEPKIVWLKEPEKTTLTVTGHWNIQEPQFTQSMKEEPVRRSSIWVLSSETQNYMQGPEGSDVLPVRVLSSWCKPSENRLILFVLCSFYLEMIDISLKDMENIPRSQSNQSKRPAAYSSKHWILGHILGHFYYS